MLDKLKNLRVMELESFKRRLEKIWEDIPDEVVRAACSGFQKRLKLLKKAKGERFELNSK